MWRVRPKKKLKVCLMSPRSFKIQCGMRFLFYFSFFFSNGAIILIFKVDMPILTCKFFTNNWLTLISEMHFVKFHPEVASCLLSRGKRKYAPLGMRLIWKYIRNYFLVYQLISHFLSYLQTTKNLKLNFWICNQKNMGFLLISKNVLLKVEPWGMRMWSA